MIVVGDDDALQALAKRVQASIRDKLNVEPAIVADSAATEALFRDRHCIAIGDCNSNALIGRLYAMRLCYVDGVYPGKSRTNPGFDLDSDGNGVPDLWHFSTPTGPTHEVSLSAERARSAPYSLRVAGQAFENGARGCALREDLHLTPGKTYVVSVWYATELGAQGHGLLHVDSYKRGTPNVRVGGDSLTLGAATDWTRASVEYTVGEGADISRILLYLFGEGDIWYDDVSVVEKGTDRNLLSVGKTGALVRTVHNPFGTGKNVIVVGGSEPEGLSRAAELLSARLADPLPDLMEIELGDTVATTGTLRLGPDDASIEKQVKGARERILSNAFVPVRDTMQGTKTYARNWYLTGDDRWAKLYAGIWREILAAPEGNHAHGPMEWTFNTLEGWDLMDECPAIPDDLKLEITNRLLKIGVRNEKAYGRNIQRTDRTIADGHQLDQGLCVYMHGVYFDKYYGINGHWKALAEPLIELGEQVPRVHDSYAYGPIIGNSFMSEYALKTGDMDYFENGNCRRQVEWQMLCSDNLGAGGTFGDDGAWRGSVPKALLYKANWYYRDDRMKWLLRGDRPPLGLFANDRPAVKPEYLLGVAYIPLDERLYKVAAGTKRDPEAQKWSAEMVPPGKAFDKLSLRSDFGESNQYMLLDGLGAISHGHWDGNSILRFTDNGRLFLTEGHYVEVTPRRHNTLLVRRDGECWAPPPLSSLEQKASLGQTGLVQTLSSAYNGIDWQRNILWSKERFFVFIDRLTAREAGRYSFEMLWRSLGNAQLSSTGRFTVDQMGEAMTIQRLNGSDNAVRELLDYHGVNYYGSYPYCADGLVKVLQQRGREVMKPGDTYTYLNVVQTHGSDEQPAEVRQFGSPTAPLPVVQVNAPEGRVLSGAGSIELEEMPDTDAALWMVDERGIISLARATTFAWGGLALSADAPVSMELDLRSGAMTCDKDTETAVTVTVAGNRQDVTVKAGAAEFGEMSGLDLTALFDGLKAWAYGPVPLGGPPGPTGGPVTWRIMDTEKREASRGETLTKLWSVALPPVRRILTAEPGTYVTCNPEPLPYSTWVRDYKIVPQTLAHSWDTLVLWKEDEATQVTISLPQTRDIERIAVRTMNTNNSAMGISYRLAKLEIATSTNLSGPWTVHKSFEDTEEHAIPSYPEYAVDTPGLRARYIRVTATPRPGCALFLKGIRAWGTALERQDMWPPAGRWSYERSGANPVTALCAAKLTEGDAEAVIYGCRDGKLATIEGGEERWSLETGARVNSVAAGDLTGDGRPEILVGTNAERLLCLDASGKELWRKEFPVFWGRKGNVAWVDTGDVDGDGDTEIVVSCENWHYYCLDAEGNEVWSHEIQHAGLEGALGDVNGDGKLETLCGEEYYGWDVLSSEGKRLFRVSGPGPITTAALTGDVTGDGVPEAIFGAQTFGVYVRDGKGSKVFDANVGGFVQDLAILKSAGGNLLIAAADSPDQNLAAFRPDGTAAWRVDVPVLPIMLAPVADLVAVACGDGVLRVINAAGRAVCEQPMLFDGPQSHVLAADVDGDGNQEVCVADEGHLTAFDLVIPE